jgi:signal transduction histidine kinase
MATLVGIAGVVAVNWSIVDRTERLRTDILSRSEAVRAVSDSVSLTVAREAINLQAFLLTGDSAHLQDYHLARSSGDTLMGRLATASGEFGSITERTFGTVEVLRDAWHDAHDELLGERRPREAALAQVDEERTRVLDLMAVIGDLNGVAQLRGAERRATIVRIYRFGAFATVLLALLAVVTVVYAYVYRQRLYVRSELARSRTRQLERALKGREEILAIVSHDLRNSLNVVVASIALARETALPEEVKTRQLGVAARTAGGMTRLIADLLDAESLDAGSLRVHPRPASPGRILAEALDAWSQEAKARGVTLRRAAGDDVADVLADPGRILQVVGNLIGNAIKFTPESGTVTVSLSPTESGVRFEVEDTGPGIPAEHLPKIFDRFYQVRSSGRAGAGLGLAIARGILEAHGCTLEVLTWPGRGTRFWFELPAAPAVDASQSNWVTQSANQARKGPTASAG